MCPLTDAVFVKHDFKVYKYTLELSEDKKVQKLVLKGSVTFNDVVFALNGAHGDIIYFGDKDTMIVADFGTQKILLKNTRSERFASKYQLIQNSLLIISEVGIENVVAEAPLLSRQRI